MRHRLVVVLLAVVMLAAVCFGQEKSAAGQKMSPEQIEKLKAEHERATRINALILQLREASTAKDWPKAESLLRQLIAEDSTNWQFYQDLGNVQLNQAKYEDAVNSYGKGIALAEKADAGGDPEMAGKLKNATAQMLANEGNCYLKLKRNNEAIAAYTKAAEKDPHPATAFFNLCATQYNTGNVEGALTACDKAIQYDPNKADAYFIKGSLLIANSKTDSQGKLIAPPGTAEALNKYLELAPDGPHAADVKQMLTYIGAKIQTTYKEKQKTK